MSNVAPQAVTRLHNNPDYPELADEPKEYSHLDDVPTQLRKRAPSTSRGSSVQAPGSKKQATMHRDSAQDVMVSFVCRRCNASVAP